MPPAGMPSPVRARRARRGQVWRYRSGSRRAHAHLHTHTPRASRVNSQAGRNLQHRPPSPGGLLSALSERRAAAAAGTGRDSAPQSALLRLPRRLWGRGTTQRGARRRGEIPARPASPFLTLPRVLLPGRGRRWPRGSGRERGLRSAPPTKCGSGAGSGAAAASGAERSRAPSAGHPPRPGPSSSPSPRPGRARGAQRGAPAPAELCSPPPSSAPCTAQRC